MDLVGHIVRRMVCLIELTWTDPPVVLIERKYEVGVSFVQPVTIDYLLLDQ